jgi:hypothetical protein
MALRIVAQGTWLYGGVSEAPVDIVSLDYDWDYEFAKAEGQLEHGQTPAPLNEIGVLYYARFKNALDASEPTWPDTSGCQTIEEAMEHAQRKVVVPIRWLAKLA